MGHQCCSKQKVKRGLWSPEEDDKLVKYITTHGHGCWSSVPRQAGLQRCGKSCRLRWINYLRPDLKRGCFTENEERIILDVHRILGNRWAQIAKHLPGRTDNEVKNFWNSCIKKKLISQGLDPKTHNLIPNTRPPPSTAAISSNLLYRFPAHNTCPPFTISSPAVNPNDDSILNIAAANAAADISAFQYPGRDVMMSFDEYANVSDQPFDLQTADFDVDDQCCVWDQEGRQLSQVMGGAGAEKGVDLESSFVNARFDLGIMESPDQVMMPCESMFCGGTSSMEQLQWEC